MATSGTINNTFRTGYAIRIVWSENSQDIAGNSSNITAKVQLVSLGASYTISSSASKSGSLTINGTKYTFTFTAALSGSQTKTLYTKTLNVKHNADGSKTVAFSASAGINVTLGGTYWGTVSTSGNGTLDTIPRASSISSVTASVAINGTNTSTVNISRASSAFTHTVEWKFGSYSKTTTGVGTSASYAIPTSWMNGMPSSTSGTGTVTVTTYNGSAKIGSAVSKSFTLTVPVSVAPTISSVGVADTVTNVYSHFGNMVQGKSKPKFTISAAGAYGSTIKTYKTEFEGMSYSGATPTASTITGSGTVSATITVTDSRGRTASVKKAWAVVAYHTPTIAKFEGTRALVDGTENYEGTFLNAEISFAVAPVSNKNTTTYTLEYRQQGASAWTSLTSGVSYAYAEEWVSTTGILNADNSYDVRLTVKDFFGSATKTIEISTAFTLLDFNKSGRGVAFGKVSEIEGVEFALPTKFSHAEIPKDAILLNSTSDLDALRTPGYYIFSNADSLTIGHMPIGGKASGSVQVYYEGEAGQLRQVVTRCSDAFREVWERLFYSNAWKAWVPVYKGGGNILWEGGMYMSAGHKAQFSELVSDQVNGVVLVFSEYYDGEARNQTFSSHFIHKAAVIAHPGIGHVFWMSTSNGAYIATKYLYVRNDGITGHANNALTFTNSGVTLNNNRFVLRYVIGV